MATIKVSLQGPRKRSRYVVEAKCLEVLCGTGMFFSLWQKSEEER